MAYMLLLVKPYLFIKAMTKSMNTAVSQLIQEFRDKHKIGSHFDATALNWFIPAAELIHDHQVRAQTPFFIGVNGSQGSGKSTFTDFIQSYLSTVYQLNVAVISLDDFYYPKKSRKKLAEEINPLLATRGVPGTHDTQLLTEVLTKLKQGQITNLPRFNKATDDPQPAESWPVVNTPVDVVLLEGWCWGVSEQTREQLENPVNALEHDEDQDKSWRSYVNDKLRNEYTALYSMFNFWLMLQAPTFDCVSTWRKEQEHKLRVASASSTNNAVMTDQQVERFIQHYQRLTEHGLTQLPAQADLVFQLDENRTISSVTGRSEAQFEQVKRERGEAC